MSGSWATQRERGSAVLLRVMLWITLRLGSRPAQCLLYPITAYFFVFGRAAREASYQYLERALGRRPTARDVFRHLFSFASVILDRALLLAGRQRQFRIEIVGQEHLAELAGQGRSCVLLGAHLGSFQVLREVARHCPVPVHALMFRSNAGPLTRLMEGLDPGLCDAVIEIGTVDAMLRVREAVERGAVVGILADRALGSARFIEAAFLGKQAPFPTGPIILASLLGVPVLTCFAVRVGPRHYEVRFDPFADRIVLRREKRIADLRDWIGSYATWLDQVCRAHPFNWFNFYDFWAESRDAAPAEAVGSADPVLRPDPSSSRRGAVAGANRWPDRGSNASTR
ncbi:MAG: acyltransferase [Acetobacteraceae bacterium]|nr:acyltransferase [Acetobacteraceae bacterium]